MGRAPQGPKRNSGGRGGPPRGAVLALVLRGRNRHKSPRTSVDLLRCNYRALGGICKGALAVDGEMGRVHTEQRSKRRFTENSGAWHRCHKRVRQPMIVVWARDLASLGEGTLRGPPFPSAPPCEWRVRWVHTEQRSKRRFAEDSGCGTGSPDGHTQPVDVWGAGSGRRRAWAPLRGPPFPSATPCEIPSVTPCEQVRTIPGPGSAAARGGNRPRSARHRTARAAG